jgi:rSAM/selenodomain-associated transferase 2
VAELLPDNPQFSIIIPVLNEAAYLDHSLARLFALEGVADLCEVIICDGGSEDESLEIVKQYDCRIIHSDAGRARQMNIASQAAGGEFLLFLHADSSLPENFINSFDASAEWGFFRLRLNGDSFIYRVIESAINLRTRLSQVAGGDQGLFFKRRFFQSLDGYPKIPLMEDVAICKMARCKAKPVIIDTAITSSSRRWQENGIIRTVLLMWTLRLAFWFGVDPQRLHKIYYPQQG